MAGGGIAAIAMRREPGREPLEHVGAHPRQALGIIAVAARERDEGIDAGMHIAPQALDLGDAPVVRQEHRGRRDAEDPVDRGVQLPGVEVARGGRREHERARTDVEIAVGDAEGIAGEEPVGVRIDDHLVVAGVTGRVQELETAAREREPVVILGHDDALRRDRANLAVQPPIGGCAVDLDRASDQLVGRREVCGTARVHGDPRVRQALDERAGAAGMIEVDVGQEHPVDVRGLETAARERGEQQRHRESRARIDEGRAAAVDDQVAGVEPQPQVLGVDRGDAMRILSDVGGDDHRARAAGAAVGAVLSKLLAITLRPPAPAAPALSSEMLRWRPAKCHRRPARRTPRYPVPMRPAPPPSSTRPAVARRTWLYVAAVLAALLSVLLWLRPEPPPGPPRAAAVPVPPVRPAHMPPAATELARPAHAARAAVRVALQRRFRGLAIPAAVLDLVAAGEVGAAERRLGEAPSATALAWELARLCRESAAPPEGGADAAESAAARTLLAASPQDLQLLAAVSAERDAFAQRLTAGCAGAGLDATAIRQRLAAAAAGGDAASLERLALADPTQASRLMSAALLGASGAQLRVALELLQAPSADGHATERRQAGRGWLQAAARGDPEAEAWYAACLLDGCAGAADPAGARAALESAARRGSLYALGLLVTASATEAPAVWSAPEDFVVPLPPRELAALGLGDAERYAWSALAAALAREGCFGFALRSAAEALSAPDRIARLLRPAELVAAAAAVTDLLAEFGAAARAALGCAGG